MGPFSSLRVTGRKLTLRDQLLGAHLGHQADRRVGDLGADQLEPFHRVAGPGIEGPIGEEDQEESCAGSIQISVPVKPV